MSRGDDCEICTEDRMKKVVEWASTDPISFWAHAIEHEALAEVGFSIDMPYSTPHKIKEAVGVETHLWRLVTAGLIDRAQEAKHE